MTHSLPAHLTALLLPGAYPHQVGEIQMVETHMSWIFMTGELAYKIKRPVLYPFVDMRTLERRHFLCEEELRLNRRFAPDLYLAVAPVTVDNGTIRISGAGEVIEHAVLMRQFSADDELASLLAGGSVEPEELADFGRSLARIHEGLPAVDAKHRTGGLTAVRASLLENVAQCAGLSARAGLAIQAQPLKEMIEGRLDRLGATIEARHAAGRVRECHGDLHCRNLVRHNGHIVAFDCLEFEPAFRWIDVAEEIAFLFMDLCSRGGYAHARAFLNAWLASSGDYEAMRLIRLYGAHRALVRAKVAALEAADAKDADTRAQAGETHRRYIDCARSLLRLARPALVLVSGLSGSGKTWLSERLTFRGGAVHIRSDVERKRLSGRSERSSSGSGVGEGLYTPDMNSLTYSRLAECANHALAGGFTAVVDATFQRRADRAMFARLARDAQVPVVLVRCEAPAEVLRQRIVDRASTGKDASEANLQVLNSQQALFEPLSPEEGLRTIYADTTRATVVSDVQSELTASLCAGGKISGSASTAP